MTESSRPRADALYLEAFPEGERIPGELLHAASGRDGMEYRCITEDGSFVGICFTAETPDTLYIIYLAIEAGHRSGGYGGKALRRLMELSGKRTFLNIEPLDKGSDNYEQRVRRRDFYVRNGFREHGLVEAPDGNVFMVMTANGDFAESDIEEVYGRLGLLWAGKE